MMKKMSAIALSLITISSLYSATPKEKVTPTYVGSAKDDTAQDENPTLAGDSLATNLDAKNYYLGAETILDAFKNGKVKGLLRYSAQHRDTQLQLLQDSSGNLPTSSNQKVNQYSALGGYLGYETAPLFDITLGATFYTSNPIGNNPGEYAGLGGLAENHTGKQESYTALGEAYLKYDDSSNRLMIGRQEMPDYRYVSLSNIRMSPITHEGVTYENRDIENLRLNFAYITKMKERNAVKFIDMIQGARVNKNNTVGSVNDSNFDADGNYIGKGEAMMMAGAVYKGEGYALEGWNYYIPNFINTTYAYAQFNTAVDDVTLSFALQGSTQDSVGSAVAGNVNSWFWGAKVQAYTEGVTFFINVNQVAYNENSYAGGTLFVRWGTPQMFNSFQVQDSELAGTKSLGFGLQYDLGYHRVLPHFVARVRYGIYDMPDDLNDVFAAQDRTEATFDLRWSLEKSEGFGIFTQMDGLSVQFRIAYDDYKTDYDFDAYRTAHASDPSNPVYGFGSVTSDFVDTRLYIDYQF